MAVNRIIGRDYEQHILQNICEENEARLIAVYGRRRVGKTYLVKYFFEEKFDFFISSRLSPISGIHGVLLVMGSS